MKQYRDDVGDSSIIGTDSIEALRSAGIWKVCEQKGVECLNLDDSGMTERIIPNHHIIEKLKLSNLAFEVDRVISVPVMKTHMYAGGTLSIKNMKGCLYQRDKTRLHRIKSTPPDIHKGKCLDYGICDLMKLLYPDYAILDATTCMEGFGPSGGTPVEMNMVISSHDALSVDLTAIQLMGMKPDAIAHLNLVREDRNSNIEDIHVHPVDFLKWSRKFRLASEQDLHQNYHNPSVVEKGACSACHAAMLQFFRYHYQEYENSPAVTIAFGGDLTAGDLHPADGSPVVLVGNCTAKFRNSTMSWCKGCPPVPSQIVRTINAGKTLDD